ncbi:hypothetical protein CyaNS01_01214 [Cyanobium sp. NS01]|nr:hypothetical protein CyaNS01_01214 [Cyanobium sp. NS01]
MGRKPSCFSSPGRSQSLLWLPWTPVWNSWGGQDVGLNCPELKLLQCPGFQDQPAG